MVDQVETQVTADGSILIPKGKAKDIQYKVTFHDTVTAPVAKGQIIGKITYTLNGEVVKECNICAKSEIKEITFDSVFRLLLKYLVKML